METLKTLISALSEELNIEINIMMVLLREHPQPTFGRNPTAEIKRLLKKYLDANLTTTVAIYTFPFSTKIYKAQIKGQPISHYAPYSKVGRVYRKITKAILDGSI